MSATLPEHTGRNPWLTPLVALTGSAAVGDVVFMVSIRSLTAPLVAGMALNLAGIALVRHWPRAAAVVLGLTSVALLLASSAFLFPNLAHPGAPVAFLHAALAIVGRALSVVAAVGAWRVAPLAGARRLAATALGVAGVAVAVAGAAALLTYV
jgi:hypothetical protein